MKACYIVGDLNAVEGFLEMKHGPDVSSIATYSA